MRTATRVPTPRVDPARRVTVTRKSNNFWLAEARFGFIETPDVRAVLGQCKAGRVEIDLDDVTYYVGHETIVSRQDGKGLPRWQRAIFSAMARNTARISDTLRLPHNHVVEIGREVEI